MDSPKFIGLSPTLSSVINRYDLISRADGAVRIPWLLPLCTVVLVLVVQHNDCDPVGLTGLTTASYKDTGAQKQLVVVRSFCFACCRVLDFEICFSRKMPSGCGITTAQVNIPSASNFLGRAFHQGKTTRPSRPHNTTRFSCA